MSSDDRPAAEPTAAASESAKVDRPPGRARWRNFFMRRIVALLLLFVGIWLLPHRWCGRNAGAWYDGDRPSQTKLAAGVENRHFFVKSAK